MSGPADFIHTELACGHYVDIFIHSSQWDFPDEPQHCDECGELRQLALRVQLVIYAELESQESP